MSSAAEVASAGARHRDGSTLGSPGGGYARTSRSEESGDVQVSEAAVKRRGLTRGLTQKLKRGVSEAESRLKPLRAAQGWIHVWLLLEIFGGMGELTIQANTLEWRALQPIELMCGDDLFNVKERLDALEDLDNWEPDLVVSELPCGPWCSFLNLSVKVSELRALYYKLWLLVRRAWDRQTSGGRLMPTEQPRASAALRLSVMETRPQLHQQVVAQCAYGLKDPTNHKPYHKVTRLDTNDAAFDKAPARRKKSCTWSREEHQTIEGTTSVNGRTAKRSAAASRWTPSFCKYILDSAADALREKAH